jgi:N-acetyltransferase
VNIQPVTLTGARVVLEPLRMRHAGELLSAAACDSIWTFLDEATPNTLEEIRIFIEDALSDESKGARFAFAVIDIQTKRVVGSTSYQDIRPQDRGLEIGWTWTNPSVWGTGLNFESKYLLLRHAFETLGAIRVAIKTDLRNIRSQRAIERIGAHREGVWRNHRILSTGQYRDTIYYSVIESEWPTVKSLIETRLSD